MLGETLNGLVLPRKITSDFVLRVTMRFNNAKANGDDLYVEREMKVPAHFFEQEKVRGGYRISVKADRFVEIENQIKADEGPDDIEIYPKI